MEIQCKRCGGPMEAGYPTARGIQNYMSGKPDLAFAVRGEPSSVNPLKAFKQGLEDAKADVYYLMEGYRCSSCGAVELFANEKVPWV